MARGPRPTRGTLLLLLHAPAAHQRRVLSNQGGGRARRAWPAGIVWWHGARLHRRPGSEHNQHCAWPACLPLAAAHSPAPSRPGQAWAATPTAQAARACGGSSACSMAARCAATPYTSHTAGRTHTHFACGARAAASAALPAPTPAPPLCSKSCQPHQTGRTAPQPNPNARHACLPCTTRNC